MAAITQEMYDRLDEVIGKNKGRPGAIMTTLQEAQDIFGYVPKEIQIKIAEGLDASLSEVYGVATFYSQFALTPRGENLIGVCMGTACYVKSAKDILDKVSKTLATPVGANTPDNLFTIKDTRCLGCCGLAPVMMINDDVYGQLNPDDIPAILEKYRGA